MDVYLNPNIKQITSNLKCPIAFWPTTKVEGAKNQHL